VTAPVRVAHVITRMIVGGAQETVLLAAALARQVDPVVICGPQTGPEGSLLDQCRERGVEVVVVPELVREVNPRRDASAVPALVRTLGDVGADLVHTHSSKAGVIGRIAARRGALPAVHTVHGWPFHDQQRAPVRLLWQGIERACAPLARRLVVVAESDRAAGLAARIGRPDQYVLVRSGLELARYGPDPVARVDVRQELNLPLDAVVIGAVNRLSPQKDPLTLLTAMLPLLRERPDLRLLVVGDGPLRPEVKRLAAELPAAVCLTGLRTDVPRLLAAMDVFVSASLWEGLPRTVLQATAAGLPVVATAAGGVPDVVRDGETGVLVTPRDALALQRGVRSLVEDPQRARSLAAAAAAALPEFDAGRMVTQLEDVYSDVLG
jgi:glycosyltransferase involved in cell wall biosynthesis